MKNKKGRLQTAARLLREQIESEETFCKNNPGSSRIAFLISEKKRQLAVVLKKLERFGG